MLDLLQALFEVIVHNTNVLMPTMVTSLVVYSAWYVTSIKRVAPLTHADARLLWKMHRQTSACGARAWHTVKRRARIIGFHCSCGYNHIQKRPLL